MPTALLQPHGRRARTILRRPRDHVRPHAADARQPTRTGYFRSLTLPDLSKIPLALIGCGGMGRRHLRGLAHLATSSQANVELVAVCDLDAGNATFLADEAGKILGRRPRVYTDFERMV